MSLSLKPHSGTFLPEIYSAVQVPSCLVGHSLRSEKECPMWILCLSRPSISDYTVCQILTKVGMKILYKKLWCKHMFHLNWFCDSHTYFTSRCKRIPTGTFHIWLIWIMFGTEDLRIMLMSKCEFCKNWFSESHIFLMDISKMLPIFSTFLSDVMNGI